MISYEEALKLVDDNVATLSKTKAELKDMAGCYLSENLVATFASPQFDNSAVDGYGVKISDLAGASEKSPLQLKLVSEIAAGSQSDLQIQTGETTKIFTGARVPSSCEAVVMREYCQEENGKVTFLTEAQPGENIRRKGDEYKPGETVLEAGIKVSPPVVSLLASQGHVQFSVFARPRVALVVTGDELIEPGQPLREGQIYDSNAYGLTAALNAMGITSVKTYLAKDTKEDTRRCFEEALAGSDLVISSGGVSVGDHDYVKETVEGLGVKTVFWRIAMKPGKPVYFGVLESEEQPKCVFGLPGNPVSVLITFHQIVKPALRKMAGGKFAPNRTYRVKSGSMLKKRPGRLDFVRAAFSRSEDGDNLALATRGQESHMLSGLAKADLIMHFDREAEKHEAGWPIDATIINWSE